MRILLIIDTCQYGFHGFQNSPGHFGESTYNEGSDREFFNKFQPQQLSPNHMSPRGPPGGGMGRDSLPSLATPHRDFGRGGSSGPSEGRDRDRDSLPRDIMDRDSSNSRDSLPREDKGGEKWMTDTPTNTILLRGLPPTVDEKDVSSHFQLG